jgi:hypothetical protein
MTLASGVGRGERLQQTKEFPMSTAHSYSTTLDKSIVYDQESGDHAMEGDGQLVGFARTHDEAETTLDQLVHELLNGGYVIPLPSPTLPLPPSDTIAEALGVLAAHDNDPTIFAEAAEHLARGVTITVDGVDRLIDGVPIRRAPPLECWPWPWRCACGETRCWHGALLEAILLAWERLGEDPRPLPFDLAA